MINREVKENPFIIKDDTKNEDKSLENKTVDTNILDDISLEMEDLLENNPRAMAMNQHLDKDLELDLHGFVDDALLESILKNEERNVKEKTENIRSQNYEIDKIINDDRKDDSDAPFAPRTSGYVSVIQGPEIMFSVEELNLKNR